jgi:hypothetical protein
LAKTVGATNAFAPTLAPQKPGFFSFCFYAKIIAETRFLFPVKIIADENPVN